MDLEGHPANSVRNGLENDDSSEPTVDKVHGVEGDTSQLDDGVIAASKKEQGNHVDDSHDTRAAQKLTSTSGIGAVVNPPHAESNVDTKVAEEEKGLQAAGQCANTDGGGKLELAVVTGAEEGSVQAVLLEGGIGPVGNGKVSLGLVVQACHGADVANKVQDDLIEEEDDNNNPPDVSKVVLYVNVLEASGGILFAMASTPGEALDKFCDRHD